MQICMLQYRHDIPTRQEISLNHREFLVIRMNKTLSNITNDSYFLTAFFYHIKDSIHE